MNRFRVLFIFLSCICILTIGVTHGQEGKKPKPKWQYDFEEVRIPIPSEDEPRVNEFNRDTIAAAAKYLDDGAVAWAETRSCVACHTTGAYMVDRPMLSKTLGAPRKEVYDNFVRNLQNELPPTKEKEGVTYYSQAERTVWLTAGLVQWDKHVVGTTSDVTDRALRMMLRQQSSHGGYYMPDPVEIPYETTDLELTQHAARAVFEAPGWLASLTEPDMLDRVERLKTFLRSASPRHDYDRVVRIGISRFLPEVVSPADLTEDIEMLWSKQHVDGGWSTRDMSETRNWSAHMTDYVVDLIENLPDAKSPASDPYMTALAICQLREIGTPANDPRIQKAVAWLKREQRESGRWWMHSLYRGNYHFTTYIATAKVLQALELCGEIPMP